MDILQLRYEALKSTFENNKSSTKKLKEKKQQRKHYQSKKKKRKTRSTSSSSSTKSTIASSSSNNAVYRSSKQRRIKTKLPLYTSLLTQSYNTTITTNKNADNYEVQDMEIDNNQLNNNNEYEKPILEVLVDKDMRSNYNFEAQNSDIKVISFMEYMIDHDKSTKQQQQQPALLATPSLPQTTSSISPQTTFQHQQLNFYSQDLYPKKYFEYQVLPPVQQLNNLIQMHAASSNLISPPVMLNMHPSQTTKPMVLNTTAKRNIIVIESNENVNKVYRQENHNKQPISNDNRVKMAVESDIDNNNDVDIDGLRDDLLNELSKKRAMKQLKEEKTKEEVRENDELNLNKYENEIRTIALKQIDEANSFQQQLQQQNNKYLLVDTTTTTTTIRSSNSSNKRINPVIIKLRHQESSSSSSEDENEENSNNLKTNTFINNESLQSNIAIFLNEAKEQAKIEIKKQQELKECEKPLIVNTESNSTLSQLTGSKTVVTSRIVINNENLNQNDNNTTPTKLNSIAKRISKKDEIKIIRDRINAKRLFFFF